MKYLVAAFLCIGLLNIVNAQSFYMIPYSFFPEKGQKIDIGVFSGKGFDTLKAKKTPLSQLSSAFLYAGGKPVSLQHDDKGSQSSLSLQLQSTGLCMIVAKKETPGLVSDREEVIRQLTDEGFADLAEKAGDEEEMSINNIFTLRTLLMSEKPSGNCYGEKTEEDLEIVLLQNPYKMKYGEDVTAQLLFKGKPLAKVRTEIYTRTLAGTVVPAESVTDSEGKIYVKLNRSGDWMLKAVYIKPAEKTSAKDADYTRWSSSFTFGFRQQTY
ncbi:DUF4198 domain-containing protein [Pararcticibacter amylolyticus]|uniref:DUF4198 domain-containing protein n=1 Tax=Pararcticibacter amylolyticus TaxID=2173175 RepID=A0A2U2PHW7_9SPHI|nr:DUF4198 domain-containing protein [Pararcticibacter amylolyticus]PWG81007.1 hypothetical protein DDR33_08735 [Pararcticibacter amylolyticus]